MATDFRAKLNNDTRHFRVYKLDFDRLLALVRERFGLATSSRLVFQYFSVSMWITVAAEGDVSCLWDYLRSARPSGILLLECEVIKPDKQADRKITLRVGREPYFFLYTFPESAPPSLNKLFQTVSSDSPQRTNRASAQLMLPHDNGTFSVVGDEASWTEYGWKRRLRAWKEKNEPLTLLIDEPRFITTRVETASGSSTPDTKPLISPPPGEDFRARFSANRSRALGR
ncbi:hypothetical protein JCM10207_000023 [Rhodosporidiobolus poonsookiae]